ncbi:MAG: tRNA pseudouridine(38-40) synthase TruA [bacterium]|nr:tRNA pseudouridine(38-40) synthase TruA [bacterium]
MTRNICIQVAYDGTEFHGWQTQPGLRTAQGQLEQAIRRVARHQIDLIGSGRTDAGVHAAGQVANFWTECTIPTDRLRRAIGSRLPKDLCVLRVNEVAAAFHATRSASSKLYRYRIHNAAHRPVCQLTQRQTYHFWHELDPTRMQEAARHFVGCMDFAAMASKGSVRETTVRTVLRCEVERCYDEVRISVEGKGFLYNQVRNMAGTLIEVGRGHWPPERVAEILAGADRAAAGPTAPARGLCLQWVRYPPVLLNPPTPGDESTDAPADSPDGAPAVPPADAPA